MEIRSPFASSKLRALSLPLLLSFFLSLFSFSADTVVAMVLGFDRVRWAAGAQLLKETGKRKDAPHTLPTTPQFLSEPE